MSTLPTTYNFTQDLRKTKLILDNPLPLSHAKKIGPNKKKLHSLKIISPETGHSHMHHVAVPEDKFHCSYLDKVMPKDYGSSSSAHAQEEGVPPFISTLQEFSIYLKIRQYSESTIIWTF